MLTSITITSNANKQQTYQQIIPQIKAILHNETDAIANMANIAATLKHVFNFLWVGFYRRVANDLILGPFQGTVACVRIAFGKGVCGTAAQNKKTIIVPNVNNFEGHIACSDLSKSEIVIPIIQNNFVLGVLDIDSEQLNNFDEIDALYLEEIVNLLITHSDFW